MVIAAEGQTRLSCEDQQSLLGKARYYAPALWLYREEWVGADHPWPGASLDAQRDTAR
jgi:hypothetical protein